MQDAKAEEMAVSECVQSGDKRNLDDFMVLIAKVRKTCFAYDLDENTVEISAVEIPFVNSRDEPYANSVPSSRFVDKKKELEVGLRRFGR